VDIVQVGIGIVVRRNPDRKRTHPPEDPPHWELLITRRREDTVFPGYWELPGGKLEPGETVEHCVQRELLEEVGIAAEIVRSLSDIVHAYEHATVRLHPRLCRLHPDSPPPSNRLVAEHAWCPLSRLARYRFPPANDSIITELRGILAAPGALPEIP
jgi:mutator protein MutT